MEHVLHAILLLFLYLYLLNFFVALTCGTDLEQKVNGVISYIPTVSPGGKLPVLEVVEDGPYKSLEAYGYVHVKHTQRKRPGRHSKRPNKHTQRKKSRGQG